jgi:hypothetical protein
MVAPDPHRSVIELRGRHGNSDKKARMNHTPMFIVTVLSFVTVSSAADTIGQPQRTKVEDQIAALNELIIPPKGTEKASVDSVYGKPQEIKRLQGKGASSDYPLHTYGLLPPLEKQEFRAFLYVTYRNGKVWRAGINHVCVLKSRAVYRAGSPEDWKQTREIQNENHLVLIDLKDVRDKFAEKLKDASWNRKASEPAAATEGDEPSR